MKGHGLIIRVCAYCNEEFRLKTTWAKNPNRGKYCSRECERLKRKERMNEP